MALLTDELNQAASGEFRCLLVVGDAGMGKTRLSTELLARSGGALALTARAYPFGQTASFSLWSEAFERHLRRLPVGEIVDLCGGFLDDLAGLLRSVAAARGAAPEGEIAPLRLMDGLAALLANLTSATPVVIAFDDVHLADASSWEALHYLAHTLSDRPVLVVASARPAELADHSSAALVVSNLEQDGQLRRLVLPPVGRSAVAELCQGLLQVPPPEPLVQWVAERSGGNPLFAVGLVGALVDEGGDLSAPRLRHLPEALAERVAGRLADLDPDALAAVEILAVMARPLPLVELAGLGDRSIDETAGLVHRLIRSRFVSVDEDDFEAHYDLAHPLLQEVVYERTPPARRRALHRRAARWLLGSGRVGEAAPHFARGADVGDSEAVDALREALREAEERRAHLEALDVLVILRDLLPADDQRWLEVAEAFSTQAYSTTRVEAGDARRLQALRLVESVLEGSPDLARRAAVKYRLARVVGWGVGNPREALDLARAARDLYEAAGDRRSAVVATGGVAHLCAIAGEWTAMQAEADRAMREADALENPRLAINAIAALFRTAAFHARFDEAEVLGERLRSLCREQDDPDHLAWVLTVTAACRAIEGRVSEVGPILAELKSLSPGSSGRSVSLAWDIAIGLMAGDIRRAWESAERFMASNPNQFSSWRVVGAGFATMVAVEADRLAEAQKCLAVAEKASVEAGWSYFGPFVGHAAALVASRSGRRQDALAMVRRAAETALADRGAALGALALLDQAELAVEERSEEAAQAAAAQLQEVATLAQRDLHHGYSAFGGACAALTSGNLDVAVSLSEEAAGTASSLGYRLFEGRALVLLGQARARSDRSGARAEFERAGKVFEACGALWRRDRTLALLRGMGTRGRKAAAAGSGAGALTRREREVARLAVKGHTARQIADALFVGERTVEGHLASVYTKLGIASKVELARRADDLGL